MGIFGEPNIEKMKAKRDVEGLIKVLKRQERYSPVAWDAIKALGEIGDTEVVECLIQTLKDKKWIARERAIYALEKVGDERAIEVLIGVLKGTVQSFNNLAFNVQDGAARALGRIGDARAVDPLIRAVKGSVSARYGALEALGKMGG
jgi:HEAT repeat protein